VALLNPGARVLYTTRFPLMGGAAEVKFADRGGRTRADGIARRVEAEARRIEAKFSRFSPHSALSRINAQAGRGPVAVDEETRALVQAALDLARLTGGRFDPTVGVLARVWDFREGRVPTPEELQALLPLVDARAVTLGEGAIALAREGMELDLGGVGKEYAVDRVAELLLEEEVDSGLVNFAGDVRTLGRRGDGRPWSIGVQDPRDPQQCRFAIRARGRAGIATSGDYERFFERDGLRYHHLLDATTGQPARSLIAVTVIAPNTSTAGRLATAAFLLGPEEGLTLLERLPGVEGVLITPTNHLLRTTGMARIATLTD
jgi:thiamine biosynthesis lipoprotein